MRETWTDERLNDLNQRVDDLGRRMDNGFDRVDQDMRALNGRIDALQRTMIQAALGMTTAFLAGFAGLAGLIATQL